MSRPSISVLVPSYNHAKYIGEALDSVLAFDAMDLEVIVIDDGSTDDTLSRLESYADNPRVHIYHQDNRGAHAALNRAIELSSGEIVFVLNSDDSFPGQRIPRLASHLRNHPETALVTTWIQIIDQAGHEVGIKKAWSNLPPWPSPTRGPFLSEIGDPTLSLLETNYISTSSNLAFRRELVADRGLRFQPLRFAHDWDFALEAAAHGRIDLIQEPLLHYRVHGSNTISEGAAESAGPMRFEIQWVVARHAHRILGAADWPDHDHDLLLARLWNSMPNFGHREILDRLLLLRGTTGEPTRAYDALIETSHPIHRASAAVLADG